MRPGGAGGWGGEGVVASKGERKGFVALPGVNGHSTRGPQVHISKTQYHVGCAHEELPYIFCTSCIISQAYPAQLCMVAKMCIPNIGGGVEGGGGGKKGGRY